MAISALEQLEQHKKRVDQLSARRTRIQVQLEAARQQYDETVKEAETTYGTADLEKLRGILVQQEAENTSAVAEFIRAVDDFERFIARIEEALANPESMAALVAAMEPLADAPAAVQAQPAFDADQI